MKLTRRLLVFAALVSLSAANHAGKITGLDKYVQAPDSHYRYELVKTIPGDGYTTYVLDMTSQAWRSAAEVNLPVWKHWLTIIRPEQVQGTTGFLFITGGSNKDKAPEKPSSQNVDTALTSRSVVAELRGVPNEPVVFSDEKKERTEDEIIAYTWVKYLKTGDETWPLHIPMTKAAVRAMDTITSFCATPEGGNIHVEKFVVAGGSKRGWTTWTTAAADKRVVAIIPVGIDMLNSGKAFEHHYRAYGFDAPAVSGSERIGIIKGSQTSADHARLGPDEP